MRLHRLQEIFTSIPKQLPDIDCRGPTIKGTTINDLEEGRRKSRKTISKALRQKKVNLKGHPSGKKEYLHTLKCSVPLATGLHTSSYPAPRNHLLHPQDN